MTATDKSRFIRALSDVGMALRVPLTDELVGVYWRHLSDLSLGAVVNALSESVKASTKFPSVADIRTAAELGSGHSVGSQTPGRLGSEGCAVCDGTGWAVRTEGQQKLASRCKCRQAG